MKDYINYSYNILINDIKKVDNGYLLFDNDNYYYFCFYDKDKMNINMCINILKSNINNNYYDIVLDKYNNIICNYDNKEYVLLRVKGLINDEINIIDIFNNNYYKYNGKHINLEELWSKKIDYLEYQVKELGLDKREVTESFVFFSGLAENAISFLNINKVNYNNTSLSIVHNRIYYPNKSLYYYNPLNLIIDYSLRDVAEYIKEKVFNKMDVSKDIDYIFNQDLNKDNLLIFYARLMFNSTYFDAVEEVLLNNSDESIIDKYIDSYHDYIYLLQDVYYKINKKNQILIPSWIKGER